MNNPEPLPSVLVVTGASGRIGRLLRCLWGRKLGAMPILWSARSPGQGIDLAWNIGAEPAPALPGGAILLHLAGQTRGSPAHLADNRHATHALCAAAQKSGIGHVFFASTVAVYAPAPTALAESTPPQPLSPYGQAKRAAEDAARRVLPPDRLTILRLGNIAGADALLSAALQGPVLLDPIDGQTGGPIRSYIGPQTLAEVLAALIRQVHCGHALPPVLNIAQTPALAMADLVQALGADWRFGPHRAEAVPRVEVSIAALARRVAVPPSTAQGVVADLLSLKGAWP